MEVAVLDRNQDNAKHENSESVSIDYPKKLMLTASPEHKIINVSSSDLEKLKLDSDLDETLVNIFCEHANKVVSKDNVKQPKFFLKFLSRLNNPKSVTTRKHVANILKRHVTSLSYSISEIGGDDKKLQVVSQNPHCETLRKATI